jgi:hypothetical protein
MLSALEQPDFFSQTDHAALAALGLDSSDNGNLFGALMISPLLELCAADGATTTAEFAVLEECMKSLEHEFELASKEELESVGTSMGLLPFVPSAWCDDDFLRARKLLATAISRLSDDGQHAIRNWISKNALHVADASGGIFHLMNISRNERPILHAIIEDLHLSKCAEGLQLIGKTETPA